MPAKKVVNLTDGSRRKNGATVELIGGSRPYIWVGQGGRFIGATTVGALKRLVAAAEKNASTKEDE